MLREKRKMVPCGRNWDERVRERFGRKRIGIKRMAWFFFRGN